MKGDVEGEGIEEGDRMGKEGRKEEGGMGRE